MAEDRTAARSGDGLYEPVDSGVDLTAASPRPWLVRRDLTRRRQTNLRMLDAAKAEVARLEHEQRQLLEARRHA